ncbi:MAG: hypothetical protein M1825_004314 [Sarcosagium campestre]|nr:MAG: hypothetical protein M1825_004314 [Sarcosagium campestre]
MAKKAAKQTARRNTALLNRSHLITLGIHTVFIFLRFFFFRRFPTSISLYVILSAPALIIEFWLERIGRPAYVPGTTDLRRSGEDLEASGLTEYMWDVLYWTWACTLVASIFGNKGWWLWIIVPVYSAWLAFSTVNGLRQGFGGLTGSNASGAAGAKEGDTQGAQSNRQKKIEKRGGQKVQYR